jgi:hypothetical protein
MALRLLIALPAGYVCWLLLQQGSAWLEDVRAVVAAAAGS